MGVLGALQTGKDGTPEQKVLSGLSTVRLKAKDVSATKNTTLQITGERSAATWTINVIVNKGASVSNYSPPPVQTTSPPPVAGFTYNVGGNDNNTPPAGDGTIF